MRFLVQITVIIVVSRLETCGNTPRYARGISLPNKNYLSGRLYEQRFVSQRLRSGAVVAKRFYASRGITDVYWVDDGGTYREAQLKYSKTAPYISKAERAELEEYARKMPFPVYLVMKTFRQPDDWEMIR